jgi:hypothetical protein
MGSFNWRKMKKGAKTAGNGFAFLNCKSVGDMLAFQTANLSKTATGLFISK